MAACAWGSADLACYSASWDLMTPQLAWGSITWGAFLFLGFTFDRLDELMGKESIEAFRRALKDDPTLISGAPVQLVISILICLTWVAWVSARTVDPGTWMLALVCAAVCFLSFIIRFFASSKRFWFVFAPQSFMDIVSIVSILIMKIATEDGDINSRRQEVHSWLGLAFLRSYIVYSVLSRLEEKGRFSSRQDYLVPLLNFSVRLVFLIFFAAAMFMTLEVLGEVPSLNSYFYHIYDCDGTLVASPNQIEDPVLRQECVETWSLFVSIYYVFVTAGTVGYGDFTPKTFLGRWAAVLIIVVGLPMFLKEAAQLVALSTEEKMGRGKFSPPRHKAVHHAVVIGLPTIVQVKDFLNELFHTDHQKNRFTHVVFLGKRSTEEEEVGFYKAALSWVEHEAFRHKVVFLRGSAMDKDDLRRARISEAQAVFVLPNKNAHNPHEEDASNILRVLSVKQQIPQETRVIVQLLNEENVRHLQVIGIPLDDIVCVDSIKMGLLGLNCRCRGILALISNLVSSRGEESTLAQKPWLQEYVQGASLEIYSAKIHSRFVGRKFMEIARETFVKTTGQVILLGVSFGQAETLVLNPAENLVLAYGDEIYAIASDAEQLRILSETGEQEPNFTMSPEGTKANQMWRNASSLYSIASLAHSFAWKPKERRDSCYQNMESFVEAYDNVKPVPSPPAEVLRRPHIVVCSNFKLSPESSLASMKHFLEPLRAPHLRYEQPVVLVDPSEFNDAWWYEVSRFKEVYHVKGSPLDFSELMKAGVETASTIVILSQPRIRNKDDVSTVFNSILVNSLVDPSKVFIQVELSNAGSSQLLDPPKLKNVQNSTHNAKYSNLTLPKYFAHRAKKRQKQQYHPEDDKPHMEARFASGQLYSSAITDELMAQVYYNAKINRLLNIILEGESACFALYRIPKDLWRSDLTYGEVFEYFTRSSGKGIPIGLLRHPSAENQAVLPYVYCGPHYSVKVHELDKVFVLLGYKPLQDVARRLSRSVAAWYRSRKK